MTITLHRFSFILPGLVAVALSACSSLPVYQPVSGDATVIFVGMGKPSFCSSAGKFQLDVTQENGYRTARVPANQRISMWNFMSFQGYQVISSCAPVLAFTPQAKSTYIVNAGLDSGKCFIELVREDPSRATGVALEPSMTMPGC